MLARPLQVIFPCPSYSRSLENHNIHHSNHLQCTPSRLSEEILRMDDRNHSLGSYLIMPYNKRTAHPNRPITARRPARSPTRTVNRDLRPVAAFRQRGWQPDLEAEDFNAPETWHPPTENAAARYIVQAAGRGFRHAVSVADVRERLSMLPTQFTGDLEVVQFSGMTRKRQLFPCYGMQWGASVYLYPMEESLVELYRRPPTPQQQIEARMFGGRWSNDGKLWRLTWTEQTIKDFYLNNVLIHEVGHLNDARNTNSQNRERFANWFAIEYGYRATRQAK